MTEEFKSRVCSINLVGKDNKLLNKNLCPMILYWDGITDIEQDIINNEQFIEFLNKNVFNLEHYGYANIAWCEYSFDEAVKDDEHYNEFISLKSKIVQNMFTMNEYSFIRTNILYEIIKIMYDRAFENSDADLPDVSNKHELIYYMLENMFNHYKDKLTSKSIINFVRHTSKTAEISQENTIELIDFLQTFLNKI